MNSLNRVFVHLVWATWDRKAMLSLDIEETVYACIADRCRDLKCQPLEIGGTENHVHVLVRMALTVAIADVVHDMKGSSSHMVNKVLKPGSRFQWQGAYGAFSVSPEEVDTVRHYIRYQKQHHAANEENPEWEQCFEEYVAE